MLRIRHGWLAVMLAAGTLATASCKKDDKSDSASGLTGKSESSVDDISLLPVDSEAVIGINAGQIRQSPLWVQLVQPVLKKMQDGGKGAKYDEVKTKCGMDPFAEITSVSVGLKIDATTDHPQGVAVVHGVDKAKGLACIDKMKDEMTKDGTTVTRDGDIVLVANAKQGSTAAFAFANDSTGVVVFGDKVDAAAAKAVLAGGSALKTSAGFTEMYSKVKTTDSLWFLVHGKVLDNAAPGAKPKAAYGSINITDGIAADVKAKFETPDAAAQMASTFKGQTGPFVSMVDKLDITAENDTVKTQLVVSNQKLQQLISQFGGLFGLGNMMGK